MTRYLTSTFSPLMLGSNVTKASIALPSIELAKHLAETSVSYIGHEITCEKIGELLNHKVEFNRQKVYAQPGDSILAIIPVIRDDYSREFTEKEINEAEYSSFLIYAY